MNIRGFISHCAELVTKIRLMREKPALVCINETFLDPSVGEVTLEGYQLVGRRDRNNGRKGGGIIVFAAKEIVVYMTLVKISKESERLWILVHSDLGPYLVAAWYRPPVQGEVHSIRSFKSELEELNPLAIGTVVVGDLNIHHKKWLMYSSRNSAEGEELQRICVEQE